MEQIATTNAATATEARPHTVLLQTAATAVFLLLISSSAPSQPWFLAMLAFFSKRSRRTPRL